MRRSNLFTLLLAFTLVVASATSCLKSDSDYRKQIKIDDQKLAEYMASKSIHAEKHKTGFYYEVVNAAVGSSELKKNDVVSFYYIISTLDGKEIETNYTTSTHMGITLPGSPALLKLNTMTVIPEALDYGISLMNVGSVYRFYVPSYLAYGSYSTADFGPHTNFIIQVEVVGVQKEADIEDLQRDSIDRYVAQHYPEHQKFASGLYFIDSIPGSGPRPSSGSLAVVDVKRMYLDNSVTLNNEGVSIYLDRGNNAPGLEEGIKLTREGGSSILIMPASIGFRQSVCVIPQKTRAKLYQDKIITNNVEPYSILKYNINLKSVLY